MQSYIQRVIVFSLIVSIVGAVFKLLHFNGANYLLLCGLSSLALGSLIQGFIEKTFKSQSRGVVIAYACIAILFKLMHWPYGDLLFKTAFAAVAVWVVYTNFIAKEESA